MKIIFAGTPEFAASHLQALIASEHEVVAVYTQPDRAAGRGRKLTPSPVKTVAQSSGITVMQPLTLKAAQDQTELAAFNADIMIVVAYGLLLPQAVLDTPKHGCINVHASLLPRWRGAAPIQRAIEAGDNKTGVTIMQMDAGLDTGDMLLKKECEIREDDTASTLHDRLLAMGPSAMLECLTQIAQGTATATIQDDSQSNYARKLLKTEAEIDWQISAKTLCAKIRAFNPFPMCYANYDNNDNNERLRILYATPVEGGDTPGKIISATKSGITVACKEGAISITQLQLPGKKPMSAADALNGFAQFFEPGKSLR